MKASLNLNIGENQQGWVLDSIQSSLDGIWAWTAEAQQLIISPNLRKVLGYNDTQQQGYDWWLSLVHQDDLNNAKSFIDNALAGTTQTSNVHCQIRKSDGEYVKLAIRGRAHKNEDGEVNGVAGAVIVVKEQAQRVNVSNGVKSLLEDLTAKLESAELSEDELHSIDELYEILQIDRNKTPTKVESFSLQKLVKDAINNNGPLLQKDGLQVNTMISQKLPDMVVGDYSQLYEVLDTILRGACEKTDEGYLNVMVRPNSENGIVRFEVSDSRFSDEGNPQEETEKCRKIIENLGGIFTANIMPGSGHTAWFELKLATATQEAPSPTDKTADVAPTTKTGTKLKILLAEDNIVNQQVMQGLISKFNEDLEIAANGQEAIDMFKAGNYDLVLMDINMPIMNGLEASKKIRELDPDIPIIAVTANMVMEDHDNCLKHGMNHVITKPVSNDKLQYIFDNYTDKPKEFPEDISNIVLGDNDNSQESSAKASETVEVATKAETKQECLEQQESQVNEDQDPIIDYDFLQGLTNDLGADTIKNLLNMYKTDAPKIVEQINQELIQAHTHAHTLAGMSENLGINGVGKVSRQIMATQSEEEISSLITVLESKLNHSLEELSNHIEKI